MEEEVKESKKEFRNEIKKKNYSLYGFIALLLVSIPLTLLFVGSGDADHYNEMTLEEYFILTYVGDKDVENFVIITNDASYDEIQVTDFATTDLEISDWDKDNYTGTVEHNETQYTYSLDDSGKLLDDSPMSHEYTSRLLIHPYKVSNVSSHYDGIMYNSAGELDVNIDFFAKPSNYGTVTKKFDESVPYQLEYTQYLPTDSYMNFALDPNSDLIIESEEIEIDGQTYIRYVFNIDIN